MISSKLLHWYDEFGRDLPWRRTDDPYKIWLSEIILQQTRIEQGRDYWFRFVERFPTVADLAKAEEEEVLKLWQGLGYYSRARNLHAAAKYICDELDGMFPDTYDGILRLKGVGRYTAAAIASFAFRLPYPVIDGNVYRLVSRLYGISTPIGTEKAYCEFEAILKRHIDRERPDLFNQAVMDFGSMYCKPTGCDCENCIFAQECVAKREGKVSLLPVKMAPTPVKERFLYYLDIRWEEDGVVKTVLQQREGKDIWKGLYEFPLFEAERSLTEEEIRSGAEGLLSGMTGESPKRLVVGPTLRHQLTHRTIYATFIEVNLGKAGIGKQEKRSVLSLEEAKRKPVSRLIDRYLTKK